MVDASLGMKCSELSSSGDDRSAASTSPAPIERRASVERMVDASLGGKCSEL
jgi:hypothetical protein